MAEDFQVREVVVVKGLLTPYYKTFGVQIRVKED